MRRKVHCDALHEVQSSTSPVKDGKELSNSKELIIADNTEQDILIQIKLFSIYLCIIEWKIIKSMQ